MAAGVLNSAESPRETRHPTVYSHRREKFHPEQSLDELGQLAFARVVLFDLALTWHWTPARTLSAFDIPTP
jgi:hypothetical protein